MTSRETRNARREAERKAKKLEYKNNRLAETEALPLDPEFPEIQPRWNPELEDEFTREEQIRTNAMLDRMARKADLPIPPPGPDPGDSIEALRARLLARRAEKLSNTVEPDAPPAEPQPDLVTAPEPSAPPEPPNLPMEPNGFVSQTEPAATNRRSEINHRNSQLSTGPRSPQGKVTSSGNSFKHGLASGQVLIPGEDPTAFEALLSAVFDEHQPATPTEHLLINEIARSHWLTQRAIRLQNDCFTGAAVDDKRLALFLRYQTTHQRAFYKALSTLLASKKLRLKTAIGFVSQKRPSPTPQNGFVSQKHPIPAAGAGFVSHTDSETPRHVHESTQNSGL